MKPKPPDILKDLCKDPHSLLSDSEAVTVWFKADCIHLVGYLSHSWVFEWPSGWNNTSVVGTTLAWFKSSSAQFPPAIILLPSYMINTFE